MKKIFLSVLALVAVAALAITGTIAYLQYDDSAVNVMTLGSVKIAQHEYERDVNEDGTYKIATIDGRDSYVLRGFTQDKPLYPAIIPNGGTVNGVTWDYDAIPVRMSQVGSHGGASVFNTPNAVDKFVTVENTGKSDAYVRTLIAFEMGDLTLERFSKVIATEMRASEVADGKQPWHIVSGDVLTVDGNRYYVYELVYNGALTSNGWKHEGGILPAGETTYPSLCQVYMAAEATNEDVEAIDGNGNGTFEIYVMSQAVQVAGFEGADDAYENSRGESFPTAAKIALDTAFGEPTAKNENGIVNVAAWVFKAEEDYQASLIDEWDGTADTSWYNDTDTEFVLASAEQLAGFAKLVDDGNTFEGKTVKLGKDLDLYVVDENNNRVCFDPIGDASNADFCGTFDGCGNTIFNLYQDCNSKHLGLFGAVYEGTVKNLTLEGARVENNGTGYASGIAAYAGAATFENITMKNSTVVNYNHNTGGIVGWCSNNGTTTTFDGIVIESSTTIGSWWGSYDTRVGGVVGAMNTGNYVVIKNSTIACQLDVYNDATSNYQWYNYRMAGMIVGDVRDTVTVDGRTQANPARVTCENVEVIFGDWANYHYCESASFGTPSYADEGEYKFRRVEAGLGYGGVDISACNHAADETHNELLAFNYLFGARDGKGIYGVSSFDGVTIK